MYIAGQAPVGLRQLSAVAFAGANPQNVAGKLFEIFPIGEILTYVNPDDQTESALAQCGMFDLNNDKAFRVIEIRAAAALGNISAIIGDRRDSLTMGLTVGGSTPAIDLVALNVVKGDRVIVVTPAGTDQYIVSQVNGATELETEEHVASRALDATASDEFTITNSDGTVVRYTHTMVTTDTLDVDVSTLHDVPVGTPATSRLVFVPSAIVLPSQVLKVSTASANAKGWLDIYVVKADWI